MRKFHLIWVLAFVLFGQQSQALDSPFKRVVMIVFENTNQVDASKQPFFAQLMKRGTYLSNFLAEAHPSQPNYIAMIAGDTLGVRGDQPVNLPGNHLGDLLEQKQLGWKVYAEDYPGNCFLGATQGKYVRRHVPFLSFTNIQNNPERCARIVEGAEFMKDYSAHDLPAFSLVVPNLDHDGHDTNVQTADRWFASQFQGVLSDDAFLADTLFIITFDESENWFGANRVFTVLLGGGVVSGSVSSDKVNHYSLLKLIEDGFGLGNLKRKDQAAKKLDSIFLHHQQSDGILL